MMRQKIIFPNRAKPIEREVRERHGQYYIKHNTDDIPVICHAGEWRVAPEWEWVYQRKSR